MKDTKSYPSQKKEKIPILNFTEIATEELKSRISRAKKNLKRKYLNSTYNPRIKETKNCNPEFRRSSKSRKRKNPIIKFHSEYRRGNIQTANSRQIGIKEEIRIRRFTLRETGKRRSRNYMEGARGKMTCEPAICRWTNDFLSISR